MISYVDDVSRDLICVGSRRRGDGSGASAASTSDESLKNKQIKSMWGARGVEKAIKIVT